MGLLSCQVDFRRLYCHTLVRFIRTVSKMSKRGEVLVAIINNQRDFAIARDEQWYRIPVRSVENRLVDRWPPKWLAFYLTKAFEAEKHSVRYYSLVRDIRVVSRKELFPRELPNEKSSRRQSSGQRTRCSRLECVAL